MHGSEATPVRLLVLVEEHLVGNERDVVLGRTLELFVVVEEAGVRDLEVRAAGGEKETDAEQGSNRHGGDRACLTPRCDR